MHDIRLVHTLGCHDVGQVICMRQGGKSYLNIKITADIKRRSREILMLVNTDISTLSKIENI